MNNFKIVAKNTFFLTLSEIFMRFIGVLWVVFLAHNLSISEYGRYNIVNSFVAIFAFLPDLGVGLIVVREIAKNKKKASDYLGNSLILNTFLAILTVIIIILSSIVLKYPYDTNILILIASFTLFISTIRTVGILFFEGTERMNLSGFFNSLNTLLLISFASIGFLLGYGLKGVFYGMLAGTTISVFATWFSVKKFVIPKIHFDFKLTKYLLYEGLPLGLASFAFVIYTKVDSIILSKILGEHSVGIYNSATPFIFSSIQLLNVPFMVALYPALSRISAKDSGRLRKAVIKSLLFILAWSVPWSLLVSLLSPYLIPLIFGNKYDAAIPILRFLIFFVPFASLSALLYKVLIILNKQRLYLYISIFGAVINFILNLIFIPKLNIMGAVFSSLATQLLLFIIYFVFVIILIEKD